MYLKKFTQKDRYGNMTSYEFDIPPVNEIPKPDHPGSPKGTDTVPAWLTPGENVINAEASRLPGIQPMLDNLNDIGRAIQKKQGGPIPSYEADGGVIGKNQINYGSKNTYTDYYGRPYQVSKLYQPINNELVKGEVEKMKSMGLPSNQMMSALEDNLNLSSDQAVSAMQPTNNSISQNPLTNNLSQTPIYNAAGSPRSTDLVQKFMDKASDTHDMTYLAKPPKYFQEGGVTITDDIVDAMMQVESGGDVNAESEAGAIGPMQILPSTAQNPGYGVKPIALEDLKDPVLAKDFAKRYMQKLADKNPTLSLDEIKTAYHSGLGNVLKAKFGKESLGPRGQAYAEKVRKAMNENSIPKLEPRPVLFDDTPIESGIMSAQANTPNRMGDPGYIPEAEDPILPDVDPMNQGFTDRRDKEIFDFKNFRLNNKLSQERYKKDQLESLKNRLQKKQEEGFEINDNDLKQVKKLEDEIKRIDETIFKTQKEIDKENKEAIEKSEKARIKLGIPKPEEIDINTEVKKKEAQKIADALANEEDIDQTVMTKEEVADYMAKNPGKTPADKFIDKAKEVGGVILDKSMGYFKDAFSSMFDGEELARMAMIYAGSRAMGYNHGASLNYSMKNYIKRVNANQTAARKAVLDKDFADRYTAASLAKYAKSADVNDLIPKPESLKLESISGEINVPGYGKATTYKGDDGIDYIKVDGQTYAVPNIKGAEKWDDKVHGDATVAKRYDTFGKAYADALNKSQGLEPGDVGYVAYEPVGSDANIAYRKIIRNNKVSISQAPETQRAIERAMEKYLQAKAAYSKAGNTGTKPNNLESFIRIEAFKPLTGISPDMITGTSPENLNKLDAKIKSSMDRKKPFAEEYGNEWQAYYKAWVKLPPEERTMAINDASKKDKGQYSGFTLWVSRTSPDEVNKILKS